MRYFTIFGSNMYRQIKLCYVKDLSRLGRELHKIIIVNNSPASYLFTPDNAVSIFTHLRFREIFWRKKIKKCLVKCNYVKDRSWLGRELHKIINVDNSPAFFVFHPDNQA